MKWIIALLATAWVVTGYAQDTEGCLDFYRQALGKKVSEIDLTRLLGEEYPGDVNKMSYAVRNNVTLWADYKPGTTGEGLRLYKIQLMNGKYETSPCNEFPFGLKSKMSPEKAIKHLSQLPEIQEIHNKHRRIEFITEEHGKRIKYEVEWYYLNGKYKWMKYVRMEVDL